MMVDLRRVVYTSTFISVVANEGHLFFCDSLEVHMSCRLNLIFYNKTPTLLFIIIILNLTFKKKNMNNLLSNSIKRNHEITNRKNKNAGNFLFLYLT